MGERAINYFNANIDNIIIGRFLGPAALGFYTLAYQISIFPLTKLNPVITKVMFPLFSKIQNDSIGFRDGYSKMVKYVALFSFPLMVGMFVVANEFILLFLGKKWVASILVLQILCIISLFKSLVNPIGTVLLAKGRADIGFYWNIIGTISVGAAVIIGVNWGITGVAIAILILQVPSFFIIQPIVNGLIKMRMGKYLQILVTPLVCSFAMLVCVFILKKIMGNIELPYQFVISVVVGIIVYVLTYYLRDKETVVEAVTLIKGN